MRVWLFYASGDKSYVSTADRNQPAKADRKSTITLKLCSGGINAFFCFWKTYGQPIQQFGTAEPSDKIAERGTNDSGKDAERNQQKVGNVVGMGECSCKGKHDFAGYRETGILYHDNKEQGKYAIVV